jgi:hypothetical protein
MPAVLAGPRRWQVADGRVLDFVDKGNDNRHACSLYLSLLDRIGVRLDRFGDTDRRLPGLWSAAQAWLSAPIRAAAVRARVPLK